MSSDVSQTAISVRIMALDVAAWLRRENYILPTVPVPREILELYMSPALRGEHKDDSEEMRDLVACIRSFQRMTQTPGTLLVACPKNTHSLPCFCAFRIFEARCMEAVSEARATAALMRLALAAEVERTRLVQSN
jgi:hypothetical protein